MNLIEHEGQSLWRSLSELLFATPKICSLGEPGQTRVTFGMKILADVGLVGFPLSVGRIPTL